MKTSIISLLLYILIILIGTACNNQPNQEPNIDKPHQANRPNASFGIVPELEKSSENAVEFHLNFYKKDSQAGPRLMEAHVRYAENLEFVHAKAGDSLANAGKTLIAQEKDNNLIRLIAFSPNNVETLDSGRIATLRFKKVGQGDAAIEILTDKPIFAPDAANEGLLVSDPVRVKLD